MAFWIGAGIAMIGVLARTALRETPEFADAKRQIKYILEKNKLDGSLKTNILVQEKVKVLTALANFLTLCGGPVSLYFSYIHCGNILKKSFNYSAEQVIHQNFIVSIIGLICYFVVVYLSYIIYPLIILRVKLIIFSIAMLISPYLLNNITSPFVLLLIQLIPIIF